MAQMTKMQQRIYDYIAETIQRQGYPPSVREIGEAVGLRSTASVSYHLQALQEKVEDVLNLGDMTWVKFMGFDEKGRANFSRKDALKEMEGK